MVFVRERLMGSALNWMRILAESTSETRRSSKTIGANLKMTERFKNRNYSMIAVCEKSGNEILNALVILIIEQLSQILLMEFKKQRIMYFHSRLIRLHSMLSI